MAEMIGRVAWMEVLTADETIAFGLGYERLTYVLPDRHHNFEILRTSLVNGQAILIKTEEDGYTVCSVLLSHRLFYNRRKPKKPDLYVTSTAFD